jgi:hypothetical protein
MDKKYKKNKIRTFECIEYFYIKKYTSKMKCLQTKEIIKVLKIGPMDYT